MFLPSVSLVTGRGDGVLRAEACGRCETVRRRLPLAHRAAGEPNEAFAPASTGALDVRSINRDASADACGYVRGDVPAVDELSRALLVSYRHAS